MPDPVPSYLGYLCVKCPNCLRGTVFGMGSPIALMPLEEAKRRLKCERCGSRPTLYRAPSKGHVRRWGGR